MAILIPPTWLENSDQHNAQDYRALLASLVGGGIAAPGAYAVTEAPGTPDMSVRVAAGGVFVPSTRSAAQGTYHVYNDAPITVVVPAADATNPRIDLLVVRVRDEAQDIALSQNDAVVELVAGTPAATPAEPTISFEDYLVLARVNVAASATAIVNSDIVDRRALAVSTLAAPEIQTTNLGGSTSGTTELTLGTISVPARPWRRLLMSTMQWTGDPNTSGDQFASRIRVGGTQVGWSDQRVTLNNRLTWTLPGTTPVFLDPGVGATVTFTLQRTLGSGSISTHTGSGNQLGVVRTEPAR